MGCFSYKLYRLFLTSHSFSVTLLTRLSPFFYSDTINQEYSRSLLLFLHAHREASALSNEIPEESDQFRFLRAACFANIKGSVGLILAKESDMRISIPLDLSSQPFIPLPRFMCARRATPLLVPSLVFSPRRSAL